MKEQISASYLDKVKRNFGDQAKTPILEERTALVVGASRAGSIGRAVCKHLSLVGFKEVWSPPVNEFDVTKPGTMRNWFNNHLVDTLVLCHGVTRLAWFEDQLTTDLEEQVQVNLLGTMYAIQEFVHSTFSYRHTRKQIVVVGSMAYKNVLNASAAYCASKAGVAHLVECLGWELTPKGYYIWGVHPSNVQGTPMADDTIRGIMGYRNVPRDEAEAYWGAVNLMRRWLTAEDVAETITRLLTTENSEWQTGHNIELKAGQR